MTLDDADYYRRRAREERELAASADTAEAANAHQELARHYEELLARFDRLPLIRGTPANQNDAQL